MIKKKLYFHPIECTKLLKKLKIRFIYLYIIVSTWALSSCSNSRYSGFRQTFVNFTTYYNTYFNIKQKYKVGYNQVTKANSENISGVLSPFEYDNMPDAFKGVGVFSETAPKTSKLVNKKPISKWVDDALLIEGKIKYNRGDYDSAITVFEFITANYKKGFHYNDLDFGKLKYLDDQVRIATRAKEPIKEIFWRHPIAKNSALIWLARSYIAKKDYEKASSVISYAESDLSFPVQYRHDLAKAKICLNIAKKEYEKAILNISDILGTCKNKKEVSRLTFIQGQLAELHGNKSEAAGYFQAALDGKLNDDLEFEARMKVASLSNKRGANESIDMLNKMLNKGSFQTKLDRIHFALGLNYVQLKDNKTAEFNFKKSIELTKSSTQKFKAYEAIGTMYYDQKMYLSAAQFYDSASKLMPSNYPTKDEFLAKNVSLANLLKYYNDYKNNDSIIDLVKDGKEDAIKKLENNIEKKRKEESKNNIALDSKIILPDAKNNSTEGGWYFTNKSLIAQGKESFQKKWGKLRLQDNWKKASQNDVASASASVSADNQDVSSLSAYNIAVIEAERLPLTPASQKPFHDNIKNALLGMARTYQYELKDYPEAIETYELLLKKYKDLDNEDEVLYALYLAYVEESNPKSEATKSLLLSKYPQSKYAKYVLNPNIKTDEEKLLALSNLRYKEAFKVYQLKDYTECINLCSIFIENQPESELKPKFLLLKAYAYSSSSLHTEFVSTLESITIAYGKTEEGIKAQELLDVLKNTKVTPSNATSVLEAGDKPILNSLIKTSEPQVDVAPPTSEKPTEKPVAEVKAPVMTPEVKSNEKEQKIVNYYYVSTSPHFCIVKVGEGVSSQVTKANIERYLKNNFNSMKYKVEELLVSGQKLITIGKIEPMEKAYVLNDLMKNESSLNSVLSNAELFIITSSNLDVLFLSDAWAQYVDFYRKNYR